MTEITIELIRHAMTPGNKEARYVGRTDEGLSPEGVAMAMERRGRERAGLLLLSPMVRCLETACLMAGCEREALESARRADDRHISLLSLLKESGWAGEIRIVPDLRECDFGTFEYKNWQEMTWDAAYQAWIDSGGSAQFPEGELPAAFRLRCAEAFEEALRSCRKDLSDKDTVRCVVHGGTIMSIMDAFAAPEEIPKTYYDWHVENCGIITRHWDGNFPLYLR